jgi:hypothetical protein
MTNFCFVDLTQVRPMCHKVLVTIYAADFCVRLINVQ